MVAALKITGFLTAAAVAWVWETGNYGLALAAVPTLLMMTVATRQYARRRARERGRR